MTWNASFKFSDVRSDIKIVVSPIVPGAITPQLESNSSDPLGRYGVYLFSVGNQSSYADPYAVELKAAALNWEGTSLSLSVKGDPVNVTAFTSTFTTRLVNVTDVYGNVMRNPDGSFTGTTRSAFRGTRASRSRLSGETYAGMSLRSAARP